MLNASLEFIREMNNDNRNFLHYIDITFPNGTTLNLTSADIWEGTFKVEDATSSSGTFTIGALIATKLSFGINNIYEKFGDYDFENALIVAYVALELTSGIIEKIRIGTFKVFDYPTYTGSIIYVIALDPIGNFNKSYNGSALQYPASLLEIVGNACADCDVTLLSNTFDNSSMIINNKPESDTVTYADIVSCAAQIAGCFARCDPNGRLYFDWYKYNLFSENQPITGGKFDSTTEQSYQTGSSYYGGNFADYSTGDNLDGGSFTDPNKFWVIYGIKTKSVATDDVVITGVKVTESFTETDTQKISSYTSGTDNYLVIIENNPLIQYGKAQAVCQFIYNKIVGMKFRPCSVTFSRNPLITSGDISLLFDEKSNEYRILITENTYSDGNDSSISCDAESASRSISTVYSAAQKSYAKAKAQAKKDISAYNLAVQQLTNLITQSFGVYKTEQKQTDGSVIYLLHNKPTVAESQTIWKMTADAFSVSTDGGNTWNAGFDSSGNAVVNVLNAIGVNADWIHGGTLYLGGNNNINGSIKIYDASGNTIGTFDKNGITTSIANITGGFININTSSASLAAMRVTWNADYKYKTEVTAAHLVTSTSDSSNNLINSGIYSPTNVELFDATALRVNIQKSSYEAFNSSGSQLIDLRHGDDYTWLRMYQNGSIQTSISPNAISTNGTKSRIANTSNYDRRLLYCYEMPEPLFGDIGEAKIDESGSCYIQLDDIFTETIDTDCKYQVFLQKYGEGDCYVYSREENYFVVKGTPFLSFGWEIKAVQKGFSNIRLEKMDEQTSAKDEFDYESSASEAVNEYVGGILL